MLGKRIRELRTQLGLSQRQLAGTEMTRHFISLVESGRALPSERTLRIIASRLGKPVSYFREESRPSRPESESGPELLRLARHWADADETTSALSMVQYLLKKDLDEPTRAEAYLLQIRCLHQLKRYDQALAECEPVYDILRALRDRPRLVDLCLRWGSMALAIDEFPTAQRAYELAIQHSRDVKSLSDKHAEALTYLGSTLVLLGRLGEAVTAYEEANNLTIAQGELKQAGLIAMGLGSALSRSGDKKAGMQWTYKALDLLQQANSPDRVLAAHNLANMLANQGEMAAAFETYQQCLAIYKERGQTEKQASILEELTTYWINLGEYVKAKACCREAVGLLELKDDGVLRGRIYRVLGTIAEAQEEKEQAYYFYQMSYALLRRLKAAKEAGLSQEALQRLNLG